MMRHLGACGGPLQYRERDHKRGTLAQISNTKCGGSGVCGGVREDLGRQIGQWQDERYAVE